jgi:hypothetical protein
MRVYEQPAAGATQAALAALSALDGSRYLHE